MDGYQLPVETLTLYEIVLLQKDLPQPTLATWIVLEVELVKTMEGTLVCMDI